MQQVPWRVRGDNYHREPSQTPGTFTQVIFQTKYNVTRSATRLLNAVRGRLRQLRNQTNPS